MYKCDGCLPRRIPFFRISVDSQYRHCIVLLPLLIPLLCNAEFLYPIPALGTGAIGTVNEPAFVAVQSNPEEFLYPVPALGAGVADRNVGVSVLWFIKPQQKIQGQARCLPRKNLELGTFVPWFNLGKRKRREN